MTVQKQALILGSGTCADQVAAKLTAHGIAVLQATMEDAGFAAPPLPSGEKAARRVAIVDLVSCQGQAGQFRVSLAEKEKRTALQVAAIVVAQECLRISNHALYGLVPSERVMALSTLEKAIRENSLDSIALSRSRIVLLNSWSVEPHPVISQSMLQSCLALRKHSQAHTYFLCGNLKVAPDGMEACYQEAKKAGTLFIKFSQRFPTLTALADGRIQIDYWDETTRMDFRLVADRVIVDERVMPHPRLANIIQRLGLEMDALGYAQGDNIHRLPNLTNRRGIFTAGGARGMLTQAELLTDADQAALSVIEFFSDVDRGSLPGVEIDPGRCARCLTCYRLCPYAAIEMEPRMTIISAACQSCGLCAAGCPNRAIRIDNPALEKAFDIMAGQEGAADEGDTLFVPKIMAFCCTRSAAQARDLAQRLGHRLPAGLRFVEGVCGGTFSVHHLLSAIEAGMDGVLVLTCHEGNCHSEHGTLAARQRVLEATRLLTWAGIGSERLQFTTLAANMGSEFARVVNGFEETIKTLGPVIG